MFPGRYWHQTVDLSPHVTNLRRSDATETGWGKNAINWITEIQVGTFQVGSQLDSIGHIQIGDRFYNGWKVRDVVEPWGLGRFGMEGVPPIVTRGVLVDVAAYKGVDRLEKGYAITVADVQGALAKQGVALGAGGRRSPAHRLGRPLGPGQRPVPVGRAGPRSGAGRMALRSADRRPRHRQLEHRPGSRRGSGAAVPRAADHVRQDGPVRLREPRHRGAGRSARSTSSCSSTPTPAPAALPRRSWRRRRCSEPPNVEDNHDPAYLPQPVPSQHPRLADRAFRRSRAARHPRRHPGRGARSDRRKRVRLGVAARRLADGRRRPRGLAVAARMAEGVPGDPAGPERRRHLRLLFRHHRLPGAPGPGR